ncbi:fungal-specific transcription factor domain-containing protein [Xylogone sp. PMI_703]|nr:fungal-specific transcription factor domain-containing protein [Xylogone sp. PMI_703]
MSELSPDSKGVGNSISKPTQKRNRSQLSCVYCRQAKLKCDRNQPCGQCMRRDKASTCHFPPPAPRKKPPMSMQKRLIHLESLVKNVMSGQVPPESISFEMNQSTAANPDQTSSVSVTDPIKVDTHYKHPKVTPDPAQSEPAQVTSGQVLSSSKETTYVGATHWAAILEDIEEMKAYCNSEETEPSESPQSVDDISGSSLLFNTAIPSTREDILAFLPPRHVVDRYVSRYFNSTSPALHITHRPAFQRQYKRFWADPDSTPTVWIGILYGMMCLAAFGSITARQEPIDTRGTPDEVVRAYRTCCAKCLILSEYTKPGPYTLEAFILYSEVEFIVSKEDLVSCYLFIGAAVRLALRMGLHRDPTKVGGDITPYQGEMRRRMWQVIMQIDLLSSFHIGLPSMINAVESDTLYPRNLLDTDFDEDSIELPPSRPEEERTALSYTIAKGRVAEVFGEIAMQANLLNLPSYEKVMRVDRLLDDAYAHVPSFLRIRALDQSVIDPPELIIQRYSIALLYNKSRCVLHRRYMLMDETNPNYKYSRNACLESSFCLLSYQSDMYEAIQGSGILSRHSWFNSSLSVHDFLLAAMIIYLNIVHIKEKYSSGALVEDSEKVQYNEMIKALERSHFIWKETTAQSGESKRSYEVLGAMIKKVHQGSLESQLPGEVQAVYDCMQRPMNKDKDIFISHLSLSGLSFLYILLSCSLQFLDRLATMPLSNQSGLDKLWVSQTSPDSTPSSDPSTQYEPSDVGGTAWNAQEPIGSILDAANNFDWVGHRKTL